MAGEKISDIVNALLKKWGFIEKIRSSCSTETELLRDLHLLGDTSEEFIEEFCEASGISTDGFKCFEYFPSELSNDAFILTIHQCTGYFAIKRDMIIRKYKKISLGDLNQAAEEKSLDFLK